MMQSQKLLGLSIYLPWLQAQMPLDTVSDETKTAINRRHQPEASETKATSRKFSIFNVRQEPSEAEDTTDTCKHGHLWKNEERAPVFQGFSRHFSTFRTNSFLKFIISRAAADQFPPAPS